MSGNHAYRQYGFCLEFITLPERGRERCLQEFFNDSPGCGTHKSTFGFTINNVFDKMRRGQRVFWGDIEDPLIKAARQMPDPYATAAMAKQLVVAAAEAHADAKYAEKGYIEEDDGAHTIFEKMKKEQMWAAKSKKQEDQQMEQEQRKQKGGYVKNPRGGAFVIAGPRGSSKPPKAALGAVATRDHSSILKAPLGAVAAINGYNQNIIAPVNDADAGPTPAMRAISWANNLPTPAQNDGAASAFEDKKMAMREKLEEKWLNGGKSKSKTLLNRHDKNNRTWKGRPKNPPLPETPEEGENVTETQEEQKDRGFESIVAGVSKIDIAKGKNKGKKKARK
ncbi:hypothetical protein BU26DRAFT_51390 [Trematosphaeria pertusa]|uniref:Uncharacterized protein n=1 Tax=Trematosphaeria pertusa TaxID=390896 RepID=A0A6A6I817_9PLEO|nr:uncharacterized protein BU26DRAFT_51390 [Trematosphaeria pertusa]KAF2246694.1 hypothetical protein BU26DRAFT_51390 [Trematosphaeria pertusa]